MATATLVVTRGVYRDLERELQRVCVRHTGRDSVLAHSDTSTPGFALTEDVVATSGQCVVITRDFSNRYTCPTRTLRVVDAVTRRVERAGDAGCDLSGKVVLSRRGLTPSPSPVQAPSRTSREVPTGTSSERCRLVSSSSASTRAARIDL